MKKFINRILDKIEDYRLEQKRKDEKLDKSQYLEAERVLPAAAALMELGFKK